MEVASRKPLIGFLTLFVLCGLASPLEAQANSALETILDSSNQLVISDYDETRSNLVLQKILVDDFAFSASPSRQLSVLREFKPPIRPMLTLDDVLAQRGLVLQLKPVQADSALASNDGQALYDIPMAEHPLIDQYIRYFTGRGRKFFGRWLSRADRYAPIMVPILKDMGLPEDTIYLAMIESGFNAKAYSSAAASGFWQFISSTGRRYGLKQNFWLDERRDFIMATRSAARFLKDLHRQFGDWHLAWAGYNAGGGRIRRALKKYGVNDFWHLIEHKKSLAKETRHYVPKLIAAAIIGKNRKHYGFDHIKPLSPLEWEEVKVNGPTDLRIVAKTFSIPLEDLETLNPAWKQRISPPGRSYTLRVPTSRGEEIAEWVAQKPANERIQYRAHTISQGDTLSEIAQAYGSTVGAIKSLNHIRSTRALKLGKTLIIPELGKAPSKTRSKSRAKAKVDRSKKTRQALIRAKLLENKKKQSSTSHKVRSGETLWSISQRYQTSVKSIKKLNGRRTNTIRVGEVLRVL